MGIKRHRTDHPTPKTPTTSTSTTTSTSRIRDNQRRSRERRRQYLRDLEQRVERFERLGVVATQEVQAAGRRVAEENALLRSFLCRLHGVSEGQLEEYLRVSRAAERPADPADKTAEEEEEEAGADGSTGRVHGQSAAAAGLQNPSEHHRGSTCSTPPSTPSHDHRPPSPCTYADGHEAGLTRRPTPGDESDQTMSCEAAAGIIANMRGSADISGVRDELGCAALADCRVRNMAIFDLLDR